MDSSVPHGNAQRVSDGSEGRVSKQESLTKSKDRVQKYGEVFTPRRVVEKMCDELEKKPGTISI